jgi:membrane protein YdbS with pleckstrin-like domain
MIQLNVQTKLSQRTVWYRLVGTFIFIIILIFILNYIAGMGTVNAVVNGVPTVINVGSMGPLVTFGVPLILLCLMVLYNISYYKMYSFLLDSDKISVTSGVFFQSTETVDFKTIQNVSTKRGPLLMLFGLEVVQGFTSSPDQLIVSSNGKGGTRTTYRPDISIPLLSADAEQLRNLIAQSAEVDKVRVVQ